MVMPGPGLPRLGSLLEIMAKRSPLGSQEKSVTVSVDDQVKVGGCGRPSTHTFQFNDFDWVVLFAYSENLEVTEDRLLRLCVTVDFDAEEVTLILPVEFTLYNEMDQYFLRFQ